MSISLLRPLVQRMKPRLYAASRTLVFAALTAGCARFPSPLEPRLTGSIGMTHRGVLKSGTELAARGDEYVFLRNNERHSASPRFAAAILRAALSVSRERPGSRLTIGDLSTSRGGGPVLPHLSHRNGRDADLLLYLTTVDGAPVASPGFVHVGPDGLAEDPASSRFYRLDVEREWLLVRALLLDSDARVQFIFVHDTVKALLLEWARARGEPTEIVWRAVQVMIQPHPGGPHDDHIHVRSACNDEEVSEGCEPYGPERPWLALAPLRAVPESNRELAAWLLGTGDEAHRAP